MPTILLTGASRGLGIEFVKHYAAAGWRVHACARDPQAAALNAVKGDVVRHRLDVGDFAATAKLAQSLKGEAIDVLLANAGIAGARRSSWAASMPMSGSRPSASNALAPLKLAEAFLDHVATSQRKGDGGDLSRLGSIGPEPRGRPPPIAPARRR